MNVLGIATHHLIIDKLKTEFEETETNDEQKLFLARFYVILSKRNSPLAQLFQLKHSLLEYDLANQALKTEVNQCAAALQQMKVVVNPVSYLELLPSEILGMLRTILPVRTEAEFFNSSGTLQSRKDTICAMDSKVAGEAINGFIRTQDELGLLAYLDNLSQTKLANVTLHLHLNCFWKRLPNLLSMIQKTFPTLSIICREKFTDDAFIQIAAACPKLKGLFFFVHANEKLTSRGLAYIDKLSSLQTLLIEKLDTDTMNQICRGCNKLQNLYIASHDSQLQVAQISWPEKLKKLDLSYHKVCSADIVAIFKACPNLEELNLYCVSLIDDVTPISNRLRKLVLGYSQMRPSQVMQLIKSSTNLEQLSLSGCDQLQLDNFLSVSWPKDLASLDLSNCTIDAAGLAQLFKSCPKLKELKLGKNRGLKQADFATLQWPASIQKLSLEKSKTTRTNLTQFLTSLPHLEELDLSECDLSHSDRQWPASLKKLNLRASNIDAEAVATLLNACPNLQELCVDRCRNISQEAFAKLLWPSDLRILFVSSCQIDGSGLVQLAHCCQKLEYLDLSGCEQVTRSELMKVALPKTLQELVVNIRVYDRQIGETLKAKTPLLTSVSGRPCMP